MRKPIKGTKNLYYDAEENSLWWLNRKYNLWVERRIESDLESGAQWARIAVSIEMIKQLSEMEK